MGNTPRDSFLNVSVKSGVVSLENINFSTGEKSALENFGPRYWERFYRENPKLAVAADKVADAADKSGKMAKPEKVDKPR
jgi:hypothetical protein